MRNFFRHLVSGIVGGLLLCVMLCSVQVHGETLTSANNMYIDWPESKQGAGFTVMETQWRCIQDAPYSYWSTLNWGEGMPASRIPRKAIR